MYFLSEDRNGHGHLYDDSSAPSLHGKNREIGAKEVKIKVSMPFIQCVSNMMTSILTRNSVKVNYTPSLRGNAHVTHMHLGSIDYTV